MLKAWDNNNLGIVVGRVWHLVYSFVTGDDAVSQFEYVGPILLDLSSDAFDVSAYKLDALRFLVLTQKNFITLLVSEIKILPLILGPQVPEGVQHSSFPEQQSVQVVVVAEFSIF